MTALDSFPFPAHPGAVPDEIYERRRATCPAGKVKLPSGDEVALAVGYQDSAVVFSDPRFTRNLHYEGAPKMFDGYNLTESPGGILSMDPPEHSRLRKLLSGTFTPRQVAVWRPRVRDIVRELLDGLPDEFDFVADFAFPLPVQVICDVMGVDGIDTERVRAWSTAMVSSTSVPVEQKVAAAAEFYAYAGELIAEHRDKPGDGLLASMINARDAEDRLSEHELTRLTLGMFLAGHETTGSVLSKSMFRLLNTGAYADLTPETIEAAVEELLRLDTPGDAGVIRVAKEDIELPSGQVIAKGEGVMPSGIGANYDPAVFPDPLEMRLGRDAAPGLTFGRGPHFCLGANLARMELQETFGVLIADLPKLRLAVPAGQVRWTEGSLVHRPDHLPVSKS